jgi:two-component system, NtrC family, nitrogen regulation response regulator GlnG
MRISVDQRVEWSLETVTRRVVVVDDDPIALAAAADLLGAAGYTVRTADTVAEFCRMIATWDPDVVLVDMFMPEMDGDELCNLIKFSMPDLPVILWSSDAETLALVAKACGADGHIQKQPGFGNLAGSMLRFDRANW